MDLLQCLLVQQMGEIVGGFKWKAEICLGGLLFFVGVQRPIDHSPQRTVLRSMRQCGPEQGGLRRYARRIQSTSGKTMKSKAVLELADVKAIAAGAEAEAIKNNWAVTIAIVDDGGHLLWLQRLDGAPPLSSHIGPAKAHTAALGRRETKVYEDIINGGRWA
jgi:hypothetical protein